MNYKELLEQLDKSKDGFESYMISQEIKDMMSIQEKMSTKTDREWEELAKRQPPPIISKEHTILAPRHYMIVQDQQPVRLFDLIKMVWSAAREKKEDDTNKFELVEREGGLYLNENT